MESKYLALTGPSESHNHDAKIERLIQALPQAINGRDKDVLIFPLNGTTNHELASACFSALEKLESLLGRTDLDITCNAAWSERAGLNVPLSLLAEIVENDLGEGFLTAVAPLVQTYMRATQETQEVREIFGPTYSIMRMDKDPKNPASDIVYQIIAPYQERTGLSRLIPTTPLASRLNRALGKELFSIEPSPDYQIVHIKADDVAVLERHPRLDALKAEIASHAEPAAALPSGTPARTGFLRRALSHLAQT